MIQVYPGSLFGSEMLLVWWWLPSNQSLAGLSHQERWSGVAQSHRNLLGFPRGIERAGWRAPRPPGGAEGGHPGGKTPEGQREPGLGDGCADGPVSPYRPAKDDTVHTGERTATVCTRSWTCVSAAALGGNGMTETLDNRMWFVSEEVPRTCEHSSFLIGSYTCGGCWHIDSSSLAASKFAWAPNHNV